MRKIGKYLALLLVILGSFWSLPAGMRAQSGNQAALVIRFNDQYTETACVQFDEPQISGLDLLQRTGLDYAVDVQGLGATICSIEDTGCPPNDCWCQCKGGGDCIYWSYWHRLSGTWQYSQAGSSIYQVQPGSVEGWSWGPGAANQAIAPPDYTFEEVCQLPATDTATPSPTLTPSNTPTAIVVSVPETSTPSATDPVTASPSSPILTPTNQPTNNSPPTATANSPVINTLQPTPSVTSLGSTEISPTSAVQPTETLTVPTNTPVIEQNDEASLTTQNERPEEEPTIFPTTPIATATKKPRSVAASQSANPTNEPQAIAELPGTAADRVVETSEPLTVVGSGVVPATQIARESHSGEQAIADFSFAEWFPYIVFLIIAGGLASILLVQSLKRKNKEA